MFQFNGPLSEFCTVIVKLIYLFDADRREGDKSEQGKEERNKGPRMKI
jgi:hypothetical protein